MIDATIAAWEELFRDLQDIVRPGYGTDADAVVALHNRLFDFEMNNTPEEELAAREKEESDEARDALEWFEEQTK